MNNLQNITSQQDLLKILATCKIKMRKAIIKSADKKLILAICESIYNMLSGNLSINKDDLNKLQKFKHTLRKLTLKSNLQNKKKILNQHGGFLQFLIPAVITGISEIVSSIIDKS